MTIPKQLITISFLLLTYISHAKLTVPSPTVIPVLSSPAQDVNISCDVINVDDIFNQWISNMGGATVDDFCSGLVGFAAVPGSYDTLDFNSFPGTPVGSLDSIVCPSIIAGTRRSELVDFVYYDDCNNVVVSSARFSIIDTIAPTITNCPGDVSYTIGDESCDLLITIKKPKVTDNCGTFDPDFQQQISKNITATNSDVNTIVDTIDFRFGPFQISSSPATTSATFKISLSNVDANLETEFFTIRGENEEFIGITPQTISECADTFIVFTLTKDQINFWAADGYIDFHLYPKITLDPVLAINDICNGSAVTANLAFTVEVNKTNKFFIQINNGPIIQSFDSLGHDTILPIGEYFIKYIFEDCAQNQTSCSSQLSIREKIAPTIGCFNDTTILLNTGTCTYNYSLPDEIPYEDNCSEHHINAHFYVRGATNIDSLPIDQNNITLLKGKSIITIVSSDQSENTDTCRYSVTILDKETPHITCINDTIILDINNSSYILIDTSFLKSMISDNCSIDSIHISPDTIHCESIETTVSVLIQAWDDSGNRSECISTFMIETTKLQISHNPINCEGDSLSLLSNITSSNPDLSYLWTGPNDFISSEANPTIYNLVNDASGTYYLEIRDGNCSKMDSIDIIFEILKDPIIFNDASIICDNDSIRLFTSTYLLDVSYMWYEKDGNNNTLLQTTTFNHINIGPSHGYHEYFVIVSNDQGCMTEPSPTLSVEAITKPVASILSLLDEICEEDTIHLESDLDLDNNFNYNWSGPNNYNSNEQNPFISNAMKTNEGLYNFIVIKGLCTSDTLSKMVVINTRPEKPSISSAGIFCENTNILLTIDNIEEGDEYYWSKDGVSFSTTTNNQLIIPDANMNFNGNWNVQVRLGDCYSDTSFSHEIIIEETIEIGISGPDKACVGDSIQFIAPLISNANYNWSGPADFESNLQSPKLIAIEGEYRLSIITDVGCMNTTSTFLEVDQIPNITAISINDAPCMDGTTPIQLTASVFPESNYTYTWSGPNDYQSNDIEPTILNANSELNGYYTLIIQNDYCESIADSSLINITNTPQKPTIDIATEYCIGSDVILQLEAELGGDITYIWNTPTGQITTSIPELEILEISSSQAGEYTAQVLRSQCPSVPSDIATINLRSLPTKPDIKGAFFLCEGDTISLEASDLSYESYEWKGPNNFTSTSSAFNINNFKAENNGAYFVRVFDGFCFSEWSIPKVLNMQEKPMAAEISSISDGVCLGQADTISICLNENSTSTGAVYYLFESNHNTLVASSIENCFDIHQFTEIQSGLNDLYLITELNGCRSRSSINTIIQADVIPSDQATISDGDTLHFCHEGAVFLSTKPPPETHISWHSKDGYNFSPADKESTVVDDLELGSNLVYMSYTHGYCDNYSTDSILLILEEEPTAYNDNVAGAYNQLLHINASENDEFNTAVKIKIIEGQSIEGTINIVGDEIEFKPDPGFIGELSFDYEICNFYCENKCSIATIYAKIGDSDDCFASNIITPNGDDINDYFIIPCLESDSYPHNKLVIFNQWGNPVYEVKSYQNDWSGTYQNKNLPSGTYYYVLDLGKDALILKGFLIIER